MQGVEDVSNESDVLRKMDTRLLNARLALACTNSIHLFGAHKYIPDTILLS
jgi:hypothetical protein